MKCNLYNTEGKLLKEVSLNKKIFDGKVNQQLLYQVVNTYTASLHSVKKAATKTRGQVKGTGKKPWRQKGTGRARVGEARNPLWTKGGIVFGPHPRKVNVTIPKKIKIAALKSALNSKAVDSEMSLLDKLEIKEIKTKNFAKILANLNIDKKTLLVDLSISPELKLSARNIKNVTVTRAKDINAYLLLTHKNLVMTQKALETIEEKIIK